MSASFTWGEFLRAWATDRGVKTFGQSFLAVLILGYVGGTAGAAADLLHVTPAQFVALPWATAGTSAVATTFVSFLTALINREFVVGDKGRRAV